MKKVSILITCMLYGITCIGQQIDLSDAGITIDKINGMANFSKDQISSFGREKLKGKVPLDSPVKLAKYNYTIDNILISINYQKGTYKEDYLLKLRHTFDAGTIGDKTHASWLDTINNKQYLVVSDLVGEMKYYVFFGINKLRNARIVGTIQFNTADDAKAKEILKDLLRGIKHK